jgi:hypothetical protein
MAGPQGAVTDDQGRFELLGVPRREVVFTVGGSRIAGRTFELPEDHPGDGIVVRVASLCHVRVDASAAAALPDLVSFRDAEDRPVMVLQIEHGQSISAAAWPLSEGRSSVLSVSDAAVTAVFQRQGKETARVPVALRSDAIQVIRP